MYNLFWQPAPPLVERYLRVEIDERILANGKIYKDLEEEEVKKLVNFLLKRELIALLYV